jgi:hypothetical protein
MHILHKPTNKELKRYTDLKPEILDEKKEQNN